MNALIEAIESWAEGLPRGTVQGSRPPIPDDDEYGLEAIFSFAPARADACPLEIGITRAAPGHEPAAYVFLDTWAAIGRRTGLRVADGKRNWIGLFLEPIVMSGDRLREICSAVAAGAIRLEAGAWDGRLVWTAGSLQLREAPLKLRGPGTRPPLVRLLSGMGLFKTVRVQYAAWH
jgi:hypothetical protein